MAVEVLIDFGADFDTGDVFVLGDSVKGVLGSATYVLGPGVGADPEVDVCEYLEGLSIERGRSRQLDVFEVGSATIVLNNDTRIFDPTYTAGPYFGQIRPARRVQIVIDGVVAFTGRIADWDFDYSVDNREAVIYVEDCLAQLGRTDFDEWTTTDNQTAGPRITDALNRPEVDFGPSRAIDIGVSTLQPDLVTWGSNVLNYLQLVARSDLGRLFASRTDVLTFLDRHATIESTPVVTFTDDGTGVEVELIPVEYGSELLFNRVGVDREGGILQTATDAASLAQYGPRTLSLPGLLLRDDTQAADMADFLVGIYGQPEQRIAGVRISMVQLSAAQQGAVLGLDLGSTVSVTFTPAGVGSAMTQLSIVEGIRHDFPGYARHYIDIDLGTTDQRNVFILDDPVWGLLAPPTVGVLAF